MNILFLDIDGVLNNELFYEKRANSSSPQAFQNESILVGENHNKNFYQRHIDFELTRELYSFCIENDAKIVVSSTWRKSKTVKELKEIFESICEK